MLIDQIKEKMEYIEKVSQYLGEPILKEDYYIEDMGYPHRQPSKLPKGYSAVYVFCYESEIGYEFLKIGKVNEKSGARFTSQHYGFKALSTLAKSLCADQRFASMGVNKDNIKVWMLNNLHRVNIYIKSNSAKTQLIETVLQYAFRPTYEGNM